jgi:Domain of Unknown Function (DUF928)
MIKRKNSAKILAGLFLFPALIVGVGLLPNQVAKSYESDEFQISQWGGGGGGWPQPTYRGAPARTIGGGTRGDNCIPENAPKPSALIPTNNVWTTLSSQPKFLWYVPSTKAKTAEFVVSDQNGEEVYSEIIDLSQVKTGTIIEENLPPDVSLETGEVYTWQLSLVCNPQRRSGDIFLEGWVEPVNLQADELNQLQTNLEKAGEDSWKQAEVYMNAGIYNELVSVLAQKRCDYQNEWQELLNWMGLEAQVGTDTIAQCAVQNN